MTHSFCGGGRHLALGGRGARLKKFLTKWVFSGGRKVANHPSGKKTKRLLNCLLFLCSSEEFGFVSTVVCSTEERNVLLSFSFFQKAQSKIPHFPSSHFPTGFLLSPLAFLLFFCVKSQDVEGKRRKPRKENFSHVSSNFSPQTRKSPFPLKRKRRVREEGDDMKRGGDERHRNFRAHLSGKFSSPYRYGTAPNLCREEKPFVRLRAL